MTAPSVTVLEIDLFERDVTMRLPFRFGIITLTEAPQAFVRCRVRLGDGREGTGLAAELMVPKWFDKDPALSHEQNIDQLRDALRLYREAVLANGAQTPFGHFASLYRPHLDAGAAHGLNPLTASFGPALIDRAVFDAVCRIEGLSFANAIQANLAGISPRDLVDGFDGFDMDGFLGSLEPAASIHARHTVGMVDPLTAADQSPEDRIGDGLPETLEEIAAAYGHRYYKLKVGGDVYADIDRLSRIARVLDARACDYRVTLDGNEQYSDAQGVLELLAAIEAEPALERLNAAILFVEQPIARARALEADISPLAARHPVIVDESDGDLEAFPFARQMGYSGISSKDCKGFYKSLINRARCQIWSGEDRRRYFMSAEDLTAQAGVAVQQDLALVTLIGLDHVERNGHHYVNGMAGASEEEQARFLAAHPDLYTRVNGRVCLRIENGQLAIGSLQVAGMGTGTEPDWNNMREMGA